MKEKSTALRRAKRLARYLKYILLCTLLCAVFLSAHIARIEEKYIPKHLVPTPGAAYLIARNNRLYRWDAAAQKQQYQVNLKPDSEFFYDGNVLYYSRGRSIFGFDLEGRTSTPLFAADPPHRGLTLLGLTREYFVVSLHSSNGGPTGMIVDRAKHTTMAIDLPPACVPLRHEAASGSHFFLQDGSSLVAIDLQSGRILRTELHASIAGGTFLGDLGCFVSLKEEATDFSASGWAFVGLDGASAALPAIEAAPSFPALLAPVNSTKMLIACPSKSRKASSVYLYDAASGQSRCLFKACPPITHLAYSDGAVFFIDLPLGNYEDWKVHVAPIEQGHCF